jgi:hypothetical protein
MAAMASGLSLHGGRVGSLSAIWLVYTGQMIDYPAASPKIALWSLQLGHQFSISINNVYRASKSIMY